MTRERRGETRDAQVREGDIETENEGQTRREGGRPGDTQREGAGCIQRVKKKRTSDLVPLHSLSLSVSLSPSPLRLHELTWPVLYTPSTPPILDLTFWPAPRSISGLVRHAPAVESLCVLNLVAHVLSPARQVKRGCVCVCVCASLSPLSCDVLCLFFFFSFFSRFPLPLPPLLLLLFLLLIYIPTFARSSPRVL